MVRWGSVYLSVARLDLIVESKRFDNLIRECVTGSSRRGIVRGLAITIVGASALGVLDSPETEARHHRHRRRHRRKRHRSPSPSPPPPTCPRSRPVACDSGRCCPADRAQCCPPTTQQPTGNCVENGGTCCPSELGGGTCPSLLPQCCPPSPRNPRGLCVTASDHCCPVDQGGGYCSEPFPQCCPPTPRHQRGGCCGATETCCATDADCTIAPNTVCNVAGCCAPPASSTNLNGSTSESRQRWDSSQSFAVTNSP